MKSLLLALSLSVFTLPSLVHAEGMACKDGKTCAEKAAAVAPSTTTATPAPDAVPTSMVVKGMHCGGCKASIEAKVCNMPSIASCKVEVTNMKKQTGKVTVTTVDGKAFDTETLKKAIADAGYEASVTKK
jgi:copper chaperone CopZ